MKIAVYTDCHCYGPNAVMHAKELYVSIKRDIKNGFLILSLGDNIDLIRCRKKELQEAEEANIRIINLFKEFASVCLWVTGNHEGGLDKRAVNNGYLYACHGDLIVNGEKYFNYRKKKKGVSNLFFNLLKLKDKITDNYPGKRLTKKVLKKFLRYGLPNMGFPYPILVGHLHPKNVEIEQIGNLEIIAFPKGRTIIDLKDISWKTLE